VDIPSFLRLYPPFDDLDEERLAEVVRHTQIEFFPSGAVIQHQSGEPSGFLYIVRSGTVEARDGDVVADVMGEGELFGFVSLITGLGPAFTLRAVEDTICYLVDQEIARELLASRRGLAFLADSLRRQEVSALTGRERETIDAWAAPVSTRIRREPLLAPPSWSIRRAAELMTRERVSSVLIQGADGLGILTDRDLRAKVVAAGRSSDAVLEEVMTAPVITVPPETTAAEVLTLMYERGIHHVPVVSDEGTLVGIVTDTDLMDLEQKKPFMLKGEIERTATAEKLVELGSRLPEMVVALVEANAEALEIAHAVAVTIDTLTKRLLEVEIKRMGTPPCPWAWLALGSEARQEQALGTDQDNALVVDPGDDPLDSVDPFFETLAASVNEHLEEAGIPRCKAGVIASSKNWRATPEGWQKRFRRWIEEGTWVAGAMGAISFDYRPVAGPLDVRAIFDEIVREASTNERFVRRLGTTALEDRPPTGFSSNQVLHSGGRSTPRLNVKDEGIALITNLARVYSIMHGRTENRTIRRLRAAEEAGRIDADTRQGLEEAFHLLWHTRFEHQALQVRTGETPDDLVDPAALGPLGRQGLKDAFRMIDGAQDQLASIFRVGR
jgi:CBS domain-containing protein